MVIEPINDEDEKDQVTKFLNAIPIGRGSHNLAHRGKGGGVRSVSVLAGPPPDEEDRLRDKEMRALNETFEQAERKLKVTCERCGRTVAWWQHVLGSEALKRADWERRRKVWADADAYPFQGWLVETGADVAFRDYWDGQVVMNCQNKRCRRPSFRLDLQEIRIALMSSQRTETIPWSR